MPASRQQKQDHYYYQYEYNEFHWAPFYTRRWTVTRSY
jgi:hypothetical protein